MLQLKISIITSVIKILVGQGDEMNTSPGSRMFPSQLSYSLKKKKNKVVEQMQPSFLYLHNESHNELIRFMGICKTQMMQKTLKNHNLQLMKGILYCTDVALTLPGLWFSQICWRCLGKSPTCSGLRIHATGKKILTNTSKYICVPPSFQSLQPTNTRFGKQSPHVQCFLVVNQ